MVLKYFLAFLKEMGCRGKVQVYKKLTQCPLRGLAEAALRERSRQPQLPCSHKQAKFKYEKDLYTGGNAR
jgi:hypothetical protein